jgi:hypothetical protein
MSLFFVEIFKDRQFCEAIVMEFPSDMNVEGNLCPVLVDLSDTDSQN